MKNKTVKDIRNEFKDYLKTIYPNLYEGDYSFLADRDMRIFEFILHVTTKLNEQIEICAKEQSCSTCKEFLGR